MNRQAPTELQPTPAREQTGGQIPSDVRSANSRLTLSALVLPAILLSLYLAQCAWFIQSQSFTFDEPINILSGLVQWRTGQYSGGLAMNDHPPLSRLLCTLPATNAKFQIGNKVVPNPEAVAYHNRDFDSFGTVLPSPETLAWHTRPVNAVLGAILGVLLWLAARSLYSIGAANFVLALFSFSPALIAHFSLAATNDGLITLMLFAVAFQLVRWHHSPSWIQTVLLGLVLGGLLVSKASALPFFLAALALVFVLKAGSIAILPAEWNWSRAVIASLVAFLVVWGAYQFHVSKITLTANNVQMRLDIPKRPDPVVRDSTRAYQLSVPVPAFEFIQGLGFQLLHDKKGHGGFLLGRSYVGGSPLYFPVVTVLKWPTMVLVLAAVAMGLLLMRRSPLPRDFALWAFFPALYFALVEFSSLNLGERYILPVYPFVLLLCGSLWQFTRNRRVPLALILVALALHIGDVLRYAPDYLSYFNVFVNPAKSYQLLSDSNVDWGEGLIALRNYQQAHPNDPVHLAYFGNIDPAIYGIQAIPLMPNERASGTIVVSATYLSGQTLPDPNSYHWVLQYPRKAILNHSLFVFQAPTQANQP